MKKTYLEPEVELVELEVEGFLCISGGEGGDDDGGLIPSPSDPSKPGWDDDY